MPLPSISNLLGGSGDPDEFSITISGRRFTGWTYVEIEQHLAGFSTVEFDAPFEPDRAEFRDRFRPFSYAPVEVFIGKERQFAGTMVSVEPSEDAESSRVKVCCYAKCAVIQDCEPPDKAYPLQFDGMDLLQIAQQVCGSFGFGAAVEFQSIVRDGSTLDVEFEAKKIRRGKRGGIIGGKGSKFARLALNPGDKTYDFLAGLAKQRGLFLYDQVNGDLGMRNAVFPGSPVIHLEEGKQPLVSIDAQFNPQDYFSEITCYTPAKRGRKGNRHTVQNERLRSSIRPTSFKPDDTDPADAETAAKAKLARMYANTVEWTVQIPGIRDEQGNLVAPNTTVMVTAPRVFIYNPSELLVRSTKKRIDSDKLSAELGLVLPESFTGEPVKAFPWDEAPGTSPLSTIV